MPSRFTRPARPAPGGFTFRFSRPLLFAALAAAGMLSMPGWAAEPEPAAPAASAPTEEPPPENSGMDGNLFLQLLVGELEAQGGHQAGAYDIMLDAARRSRDEGLFQRAVELAVQARAGDKALAATKAWRTAMPESSMALRMQLQLLVALDKPAELVEPIRALIDKEQPGDRGGTIASLPRFLASMADKPRALASAEQALAPFANAAPTRTAVRTALARIALAADQPAVALNHVRRALADDPSAPGPTLVAMELMAKDNAAEALVQGYLARSDALPPVRLAYARALDQQQRIGEAAVQLRAVLAQQPDQPAAWLTLGAYMVDLREPDEAVKALERFLSLSTTAPAAPLAAGDGHGDGDGDGPDKADPRGMIDLSYLLLAQAQEIRGNDRVAGQWLDKIEPSRVDMSTLARRASLMARAGQLDQARALVRDAPARDQPDARTRLLAEAQVLRDQKRWSEAYELLLGGVRKDPEDTVLMYELAMVAERLNRYDDMEALLRRVITLKPDDHHAHNALGYSLADRNIRLAEALGLVQRASTLAPHDPFIADSLGWVEYRLGHNDEALKLLRRSHLARPHVEVAAHLGELLWVTGQRDEAMRVWREGRTREGDNDVLQETLARLKVKL